MHTTWNPNISSRVTGWGISCRVTGCGEHFTQTHEWATQEHSWPILGGQASASHHHRPNNSNSSSSNNNSSMQTPNQRVSLLFSFLYNVTLTSRRDLWDLDVKAVGHHEHADGYGRKSTRSAKLVSLNLKDRSYGREVEVIVAWSQGCGGWASSRRHLCVQVISPKAWMPYHLALFISTISCCPYWLWLLLLLFPVQLLSLWALLTLW